MKSYIITLLSDPWSLKLSSECVNQAAKFGIGVEVFEAISGQEYQQHLDSNKLHLHPGRGSVYFVPGTYGCFLSHFYLWEKCLNMNEPLLILEHDGFIIRELPSLDKFEDVLKLDCYNPYDMEYNSRVTNSLHIPLTFNNNIKGIYNERVFGWYTWGAYAYIIKPSGANKLVTFCKEFGFSSADNVIADRILNVTIPNVPIARLHPVFNGNNIKKLTTIK